MIRWEGTLNKAKANGIMSPEYLMACAKKKERDRILRFIRRKGRNLNSLGDGESVKIGEFFFLLAQEIENLRQIV